jgi:hypothetical protein
LRDHFPVTDRASLAVANDLIANFGDQARIEAANRADRSRRLGNVIHFCQWRTVERTIAMLKDPDAHGTIH